jgi:hypothetical protein
MYLQQLDYTFASTSIEVEVQSQLYRLFRGIPRPGHLAFRIALDQVCFNRRKFEFKEPIELCLVQDHEVWSCEACGIVSVGSDPQEAAMSFCEDFSVCWDQIAQKPDECLSDDAQATKKCMLSVVKSVD